MSMTFLRWLKLFILLSALVSAPGFAMSDNYHEHCSSDSTLADHISMPAQPSHGPNDTNHCANAPHCVLCFSLIPAITFSIADHGINLTYQAITRHWLSRTLQPELPPPQHYSA